MKRIFFLIGLLAVSGILGACASAPITGATDATPTGTLPTSAPIPSAVPTGETLPQVSPTFEVSVPPTVPLNRTPAPEVPPPINGAPTRPAETAVNDPSLEKLINEAKQDLAGRVSAASGEITVKQAEATEWSDASLGCPMPGVMYAQVITPGYLIVLEANGQEWEYHASTTMVRLCER
jgi:hypothetical protein